MGLLDVQTAQLFSSEASFADQATLMRGTIHTAEGDAQAAQATHQGESAVAFQAAHARFVEAAGKINTLLDMAQTHLGEGASTYVAQEAAAAADIAASGGGIPT